MSDTFSDLSDWDEDICESLDAAAKNALEETDDLDNVKIQFVSDQLIKEVIENVNSTPIMRNVIQKKKPKQSKSTTKEDKVTTENLPKLNLVIKKWEKVNSKEIFMNALKTVSEDRIYNIGMFKETREKQLESLKLLIEEDIGIINTSLESVCKALYDIIASSSKGEVLASELKKSIFQSYYANLSNSKSVINKSFEHIFIRLVHVDNPDLLRQKLTRKILVFLLQFVFEDNTKDDTQESNSDFPIGPREQNIVRYVSGYIIHALLKHYKAYSNPINDEFVKALETFADFGTYYQQHFLNHTRIWIDCTDRGGLFKISDQVYLFFRSMEYAVRSIFKTSTLENYIGQNLKDVICRNILNRSHVINNWDTITKESDLNDKQKRHLLVKIALYFTNIRGNAFVKAWVDQAKKKSDSTISKKAEHSQRKQLSK